jgi:hypothetical protein
MAGSPTNQFSYTLKALNFINSQPISQEEFINWLMREFGLRYEFARKALQTVMKGCGLIRSEKRKLYLTLRGKELITTANPKVLLESFIEHYGGFEELFEVMIESGGQPAKELLKQWQEKIFLSYPSTKTWKPRYIKTQFQHRLYWLRSLGFVKSIGADYLLSSDGFKMALELKKAKNPQEALEISHHELEKKMQFLGEFFQFEARKRPSVNDILPPYRQKLQKDRQLDCLWVRTVHFAGKIQYPIEIQISGSIADSIERLEMIANFVQKAIVITDCKQQKEIQERLEMKRSPLLDKIVFIDIEDVDKIVEAATIMKTITDKIFG